MKFFQGLLLAGSLIWSGSIVSAEAAGKKEPDPTSQAAWSAGTASGEGNFQSYCIGCHGDDGKGDGPLAESLDVKPRDLSDPAFTSSKSDAHLFKVIKQGGASVGLTENKAPFSGQLSDEEITNVVAYLREAICKCAYKKE